MSRKALATELVRRANSLRRKLPFRGGELAALMEAAASELAAPTPEAAFKAGWKSGYYDGGEHDCRMFVPTAERAWQDYLRELSSTPGSKGRNSAGHSRYNPHDTSGKVGS